MGALDRLVNLAREMLGTGSPGAGDPDVVDCTHGSWTPEPEVDFILYVDSALDAWEILYEDANDKPPSDEERVEMKLLLRYAYEEASALQDALTYLSATMLGCEEDDVPDAILRIASLALMEYLNGNLRVIQDLYYTEDEEGAE